MSASQCFTFFLWRSAFHRAGAAARLPSQIYFKVSEQGNFLLFLKNLKRKAKMLMENVLTSLIMKNCKKNRICHAIMHSNTPNNMHPSLSDLHFLDFDLHPRASSKVLGILLPIHATLACSMCVLYVS